MADQPSDTHLEFRGTWISPLIWTVVIIVFFTAPAGLIFLEISKLLFGGAIREEIALVAPGTAMLAYCWAYHRTLRVQLTDDSLTKSSLFGSTNVRLDAQTVFNYKISKPGRVVHVDLGGWDEVDTNYSITIRHSGRKVKIGSAVKGISLLFLKFVEIERELILPEMVRLINQGKEIRVKPFLFRMGSAKYGAKSFPIPVDKPVVIVDQKLILHFPAKRLSIPLKQVENPFAVAGLVAPPER